MSEWMRRSTRRRRILVFLLDHGLQRFHRSTSFPRLLELGRVKLNWKQEKIQRRKMYILGLVLQVAVEWVDVGEVQQLVHSINQQFYAGVEISQYFFLSSAIKLTGQH